VEPVLPETRFIITSQFDLGSELGFRRQRERKRDLGAGQISPTTIFKTFLFAYYRSFEEK